MHNNTFDILSDLQKICGYDNVQVSSNLNKEYGKDEATKKIYEFDYLVKPACELEIAEIIKICNKYNIPITPRGGGSSVSGGSIPFNKGLILSTERLNKIIEINIIDKVVIAEAGVVTDFLCESIEENGLYFPIRPGSGFMSFIGGNVAHNSGSINSLKYGSTKDYVLNLQVVLPNGEIIWTGANTSKNSTGINLTQLFVGSEGILGVITKIVLKLIPKPLYEFTLKAEFTCIKDLCDSIIEIRKSDLMPTSLELIDEFSVNLVKDFLKNAPSNNGVNIKSVLLINFDGNNQEILDQKIENCYEIIKKFISGETLIGKTHIEKQKLWEIRMNIGAALSQGDKAYRDIDIAVPVSRLYEFIISVVEISKLFQIKVACFGHAGNGNLHTMVSVEKTSELENENILLAIDQIYKTGVALGGTISGEHGIGILQKKYMLFQYSKPYLNLINEIKKIFDPKNIMNPGKII